jgi:hypothetical protein
LKYVARIRQVVVPGVHRLALLSDSEPAAHADMPSPDRIEIVHDEQRGCCMMYRYTANGEACGDTWQQNLDEAYAQAKYEYGLEPKDFLQIVKA